MKLLEVYLNDAVTLLSRLITTPSVSREEKQAADILEQTVRSYGFTTRREANNVWTIDPFFDDRRPTLLLNAHIDTVRPVASWTRDPYAPALLQNRLYGLGSNDCGGGLVTLLQVFRYFCQDAAAARQRSYNLVYLASAEEEVSGSNGISLVLPLLPPIDVALVGEPTGLQPAIAEKGLMVLDLIAHGKSGHAARGEGVNAIYEALDDLLWLRDYRFEKVSPLLGPTRMMVTVVNAGTQHNVVPDQLTALIDVRPNELYTNEEVFQIIQSHCRSEIKAHSFRLHSSRIDSDHPLIRKCVSMGMTPYGSPTLSDQALMPFPSFKLGPGESARSHTADEYIEIEELRQALCTYCSLLSDETD